VEVLKLQKKLLVDALLALPLLLRRPDQSETLRIPSQILGRILEMGTKTGADRAMLSLNDGAEC
jgi:hypothetical protein